MKVNTRVFGEIDIADDKIIHFQGGIVGFPDLTDFALVHDAEKEGDTPVRWMQSLQEPNFAMPVMDPLVVCPDYSPEIDRTKIEDVGDLNDDDILVLVTVTVPHDLAKMTVNLMGPFVINVKDMKGTQAIVENDNYPVKFPIYDILKKNKEANS